MLESPTHVNVRSLSFVCSYSIVSFMPHAFCSVDLSQWHAVIQLQTLLSPAFIFHGGLAFKKVAVLLTHKLELVMISPHRAF